MRVTSDFTRACLAFAALVVATPLLSALGGPVAAAVRAAWTDGTAPAAVLTLAILALLAEAVRE